MCIGRNPLNKGTLTVDARTCCGKEIDLKEGKKSMVPNAKKTCISEGQGDK